MGGEAKNGKAGEAWRDRRIDSRNRLGFSLKLPLLLLTAWLATESAQAQTPPTPAQALPFTFERQREEERERALREQMERAPDVRLPTGATPEEGRLPDNETPCFPINTLRLDDPTGQFGWALDAADRPGDPATGRCLGSTGINRVLARIQDAIIARGYVTTRVLAEAQDLKSGELRLTLVPGRIRAIRFADGDPLRANAWNALPAAPGDLLNLRDIEQALENWKRVPTVEADIRIEPGDAPGESDVVVTWKQAFPLRFTLSANDGGSRTTGKYLGNATLSGDNLLALNDLFYYNVSQDMGGGQSGSRGTRGDTLHYSLPFGYWQLAYTRSSNRYHQSVAGASQDYDYRGTSETQDVRLSRLVYRDAIHKSTLSLRAYLNNYRNYIDNTEIAVQRRRMAGWEAGFSHRAFLGEATLDFNLAYRHGTGAFDALKAPEEAFDEGTARPRLTTADAALTVPFKVLGRELRYRGEWRAQWDHTPLVPQDRFSIGGRYTVRGFDGESLLMAERGQLLRNDLSLPFAGSHEAYWGLDYGRVAGPSADLLVGQHLVGTVLGLRGAWKQLSYDVFAGRPVSRPAGFQTHRRVAGFNLSLSF